MRFGLGQQPGTLRRRVTVAFAVGALAVSVLFAGATYTLTRDVLLQQRERAVLRQAFVDAGVVRAQLSTAGTKPPEALEALDTNGAIGVLIHQRGEWFTSSLEVGSAAVPRSLQETTAAGSAAYTPARVRGKPALVVGVPVASVGVEFYEIRPLDDVQQTLRTLAMVLAGGAAVAVALAAALGARSSRRVLQPLAPLAGTAAAIASGQLSSRLPETRDPDLAAIVGTFNSMVDALQQRIERDSRFAADVSHELRSPLTTLVGAVDLLHARAHELSPNGRRALTLVGEEVHRLHRLLEDLIDLSRADPRAIQQSARPVDVVELVRGVLAERRIEPEVVVDGARPHLVCGDPRALRRLVTNLVDNAERHAGGVTTARVGRDAEHVTVAVEDSGPGVPASDRERVFDRFATLGAARGTSSSTGLGLALVRETATAHGGSAWYDERPAGGARFVVRLPEHTP